ncbi:hypothetical protein [Streptomyces brasiliscabiei]|uniref:hypothetical protein n=1 Tax=Streptomyces brasiliscabiei TaxID=2736302 RepID=UPI001C10FC09|nr:hypothetical protein [Streptomyces brasiliscabiei]
MSERVRAKVLLVVGDQAEITTAHRDHSDPERVPVARLVEETGLSRGALPGASLTAVVDGDGELVRFERT